VPYLHVESTRLEYLEIEAARPGLPSIVMLHEGLGSVALWQGFPAALAKATGHRIVAYSRRGYGESSPLTERRSVRYLHDEALTVLPKLLDHLAIDAPILFGHSDGASIAIIHAGGSGRRVCGLILLAPHVMVEDLSVRSIDLARQAYASTDLRSKLSRYHADVDSAFRGWNEIWLDPAFRSWNIEEYLPRITCPVLAVQGCADEYGTMAQLDLIAGAAPDVELLKLENCGHSAHRDQADAVLQATRTFIRRMCGTSQC
jgi:pimeloyl-ACP methyl ester carboxylesterase